jgi:hypothetical protein
MIKFELDHYDDFNDFNGRVANYYYQSIILIHHPQLQLLFNLKILLLLIK